jgi:PRTRC genetic system protein E
MSLLQIMQPLLKATTGTASFTLSKAEDGNITLVIQPLCTVDEQKDAELTALKAALTMPIKIEGDSVAAIEAALQSRIDQVQPKRDEWGAQLAQIEAGLQAAKAAKAAELKKPAAKTSTAAPAPTSSKPAVAKPAATPKAAPVIADDEAAVSDDDFFL